MKKELLKHIDLVSGYQIPSPSRASVAMTFLEDRELALRWYLFLLFIQSSPIISDGVIMSQQLQSRPSLFFPVKKPLS